MLYKPFYLGQHKVPPQNQVPLQVEWINDILTFHLLDAFTLDCIVILRRNKPWTMSCKRDWFPLGWKEKSLTSTSISGCFCWWWMSLSGLLSNQDYNVYRQFSNVFFFSPPLSIVLVLKVYIKMERKNIERMREGLRRKKQVKGYIYT